jgi:O-antigen/teichoic acid export membrane protein
MIQNFKKKFSYNIHFLELLKDSSIAFLYKILGMGLGYLFTLLIARWYGADMLGVYTISLTILNIIVVFSVFGFDNTLLKFIAKYASENKPYLFRELYLKALLISLLISIIFTILLFFTIDFLAMLFENKNLISFLKIACFAIIPYTFLKINVAMLKGLKKTKLFSFFEMMSIFLLTTLLFIFLHSFLIQKELIIISNVLAIFISAILSFIGLKKYISVKSSRQHLGYKSIIRNTSPMLLSSSFILIIGWADTIMLSLFRAESEVGVYTLLIKLAGLTSLTLIAINSITAPKFSEFYAKNDLNGLKQIVYQSSKMIVYSSLPIILFLTIFSEYILKVFGEEFVIGMSALWILMIGQFVNVMSGSVGYLMQMTNKQTVFQNIIIGAFLINIILNYLLIPKFGMNGAAFASMTSMLFWNISSVIYINRTMGILTLYLPIQQKL